MLRVLQRIGSLLTVAATTASLLLAFRQWQGAETLEVWVALLLLGTFALLSLVLVAWQDYRYARKARSAEALPGILRSAQVTVGEPLDTLGACKSALAETVREAAEAFSLMTGTRVSACIKVVKAEKTGGEHRFRVEDIVRDPKSVNRNGRGKSLVKHWVDDNSDFRSLIDSVGTPAGEYYINGWLPGEWEYENSSFPIYGDMPKPRILFFREILRDFQWPLPYKSTLVVPIRNTGPNPEEVGPLVGFFCIDSRARHAFSSRYNVPVFQVLAELAQPVLNRMIALSEAANAVPAGS